MSSSYENLIHEVNQSGETEGDIKDTVEGEIRTSRKILNYLKEKH